MTIRRRQFIAAAAAAPVAFTGGAHAQAYPSRPIKLIYTYAPGGPGDGIARALAQSMSNTLGQQVIVDNRVGGSGAVGTLAVQRSPADGYTFLLTTITTVVQIPMVTKDPGFDPVTALAPVANVGMNPLCIMVHPSVPAHDFPSFREWALKQTGGLDVAVSGPTLEVATSLLAHQTGIKFVTVKYRGAAPALQAVLTGETKAFFETPSATVRQYLREGRLKVIAVSTAQPSPLLPGALPISQFVPNFVQDINFATWAPAGTPADVVARLRDAIYRAMDEPGMGEKFIGVGVVPARADGAEVTRITQREMANIRRVMEIAPVKWGE